MNRVSGWAARAVRLLLYVMACAPAISHADDPTFEEGVHKRLVDDVNAAQGRDYSAIVESFDRHLASHPDDVIAAVEKCEFIQYFAGLEDPVVESAGDDSEACAESLKSGKSADAPPVQLFLLNQEWGEEGIRKAESLVAVSKEWSPKQRARLHEYLSRQFYSDELKGGSHALLAIRLDPTSSLRLSAAQYLVRIGGKAAAARLIEDTPRDQWQTYSLSLAVKLLVGIDQRSLAMRLVEQNASVHLDPPAQVVLARALFAAREKEAARKVLKQAAGAADGNTYYGVEVLHELFDIQLEYGSAESASDAYRKLRNKGYRADPFGYYRLKLSMSYPSASWRWGDALGPGAFVLVLAFCAALPLVVVAPLHYRGVVKQVRGHMPAPPSPTAPWSWRHAWYALAVFQVAGALAIYLFDYPTFHRVFVQGLGLEGHAGGVSNDRHLGNALLFATGLAIVALAPLARKVSWRPLLLGEWSVKRSVFAGLGMAIGIRVLEIVWQRATHAALGTDTVRGMQGINASYGVGVLLLYAALIVPIVEEFVFRAVLLRTISRYFAVWFAVLVQAIAFVVSHEDFSGYPIIFVLALTAAWLARRSGGLLASITLHSVNNALATWGIVAASRLLDRFS